MSKANRRNFLGCGASIAATATATAGTGQAQVKATKKVIYPNGKKPEKTPLFSGTVAIHCSNAGTRGPGISGTEGKSPGACRVS